MVLPARNPIYTLTIDRAKASDAGLKVGLIRWIVGMILATGYFAFVYRCIAGKVVAGKDPHGHR
jgi:cytochrome bd ubiquinol oxidase subunit II